MCWPTPKKNNRKCDDSIRKLQYTLTRVWSGLMRGVKSFWSLIINRRDESRRVKRSSPLLLSFLHQLYSHWTIQQVYSIRVLLLFARLVVCSMSRSPNAFNSHSVSNHLIGWDASNCLRGCLRHLATASVIDTAKTFNFCRYIAALYLNHKDKRQTPAKTQ